MAIAEALEVGRAEIMRNVHTNQPTGQQVREAPWRSGWSQNGFKVIDKAARSRLLLKCLGHREPIERVALRAGQPTSV